MTLFMVVDDSPVIRKVARRILEALDFETAEAGDASEALDQCRRSMPDAILLDGFMPGMDGYQFLKELRRQPSGHRPKVIYCTTENEVAQIARAMHSGADDFMMKPFDRELMQAKLQQMGLLSAKGGKQ
jgi:two-component system chemotaxis response regulator CheY